MLMKNMLFAIALGCLTTANAQSIKTPAPSPSQTIKQDFGLGSIELSYSRPNVKGRTVFGDLVPFGQVWRTGANAATTLTFTDEVSIGGKKVPAGKYGLLTIPDKNEWTFIITKQLDVTSPGAYKEENDVVRVKAKPATISNAHETLTMQFANVKSNSIDLNLMWDKQALVLPITTDVESKIMAQINNAMNKDNRPYFQSAMYYLDNGKDIKQALAWLDKAVEQQPDAYWIHHQRANALVKAGRKDEAKKTAQKSMDLARQQNNMDYVRLNEKLIAGL
jgi:hypothetical protein